MTREQLRQRIDAMECLHDLLTAIDDMGSAEFKAGETIDLTLSDRSEQKAPIAFVHSLPPEIVTAGLRAMAKSIEEQLARRSHPGLAAIKHKDDDMNARPTVSRASRIGLVYVTSNDEPANEADAGIALRDWPLPPVKPFNVIDEETQADARSIVRGAP